MYVFSLLELRHRDDIKNVLKIEGMVPCTLTYVSLSFACISPFQDWTCKDHRKTELRKSDANLGKDRRSNFAYTHYKTERA